MQKMYEEFDTMDQWQHDIDFQHYRECEIKEIQQDPNKSLAGRLRNPKKMFEEWLYVPPPARGERGTYSYGLGRGTVLQRATHELRERKHKLSHETSLHYDFQKSGIFEYAKEPNLSYKKVANDDAETEIRTVDRAAEVRPKPMAQTGGSIFRLVKPQSEHASNSRSEQVSNSRSEQASNSRREQVSNSRSEQVSNSRSEQASSSRSEQTDVYDKYVKERKLGSASNNGNAETEVRTVDRSFLKLEVRPKLMEQTGRSSGLLESKSEQASMLNNSQSEQKFVVPRRNALVSALYKKGITIDEEKVKFKVFTGTEPEEESSTSSTPPQVKKISSFEDSFLGCKKEKVKRSKKKKNKTKIVYLDGPLFEPPPHNYPPG